MLRRLWWTNPGCDYVLLAANNKANEARLYALDFDMIGKLSSAYITIGEREFNSVLCVKQAIPFHLNCSKWCDNILLFIGSVEHRVSSSMPKYGANQPPADTSS